MTPGYQFASEVIAFIYEHWIKTSLFLILMPALPFAHREFLKITKGAAKS